MLEKKFYIFDIELKVKEILVSAVIIMIMVASGISIGGVINRNHMKKVSDYNTALKIEQDETMFSYNLKTNVGKTLIHDNIIVLDPVECFDIGGQYGRVTRDKEHYTMHTRTVTHTDSKGNTYTTIETYWTWDVVKTEHKYATSVDFCGQTLPYDIFSFGHEKHIDTINIGSSDRYVYYGSPIETEATVFTILADNKVNDVEMYENKTIDEVLKEVNSNVGLTLFIIGWSILTCGALVGFYYLDNDWLD